MDTDGSELPEYIVLELTRRCNNRCLYCYAVWGDSEQYSESGPDEMTTAETKDAIRKLREELPVDTIGLSGGEPFLREDLPEIVSFISELGISPAIITNGTLITDENIEATIRSASVYQIPLLSQRKEIHDRLVGRAGAWDAAIRGMKTVAKAGGNVAAVFVATRLNSCDLEKTAKLALVLGARVIMYNRINLGAHNMRFARELLPTAAMIAENLDTLEEIGETYGLPSAASVVLEPCVIPLREYRHVNIGFCPLAGKGSYFTIDPVGNIRICNHSPVILGNVKRDSIREIIANHPYVSRFRNTYPDECVSCDPVWKDVCRGGCKAASEQCYGTVTRVDPFVSLVRE